MNTAGAERLPDAGDIVWVDFDPVRGREQQGVRPALVLTDQRFHQRDRRSIVCPITSNPLPWPTKVLLPDGFPVHGGVLVDQIRSVDRSQRGFRFIARAPETTLLEVRATLAALVGIDLGADA
jgi:mRNA interferase MazF